MAYFGNYQYIHKTTHFIYISEDSLDDFKTKKLLGLKVIEVVALPIDQCTRMLSLEAEGVSEVIMDMDVKNQNCTLRFKLK